MGSEKLKHDDKELNQLITELQEQEKELIKKINKKKSGKNK